jgi:hypothetical protein
LSIYINNCGNNVVLHTFYIIDFNMFSKINDIVCQECKGIHSESTGKLLNIAKHMDDTMDFCNFIRRFSNSEHQQMNFQQIPGVSRYTGRRWLPDDGYQLLHATDAFLDEHGVELQRNLVTLDNDMCRIALDIYNKNPYDTRVWLGEYCGEPFCECCPALSLRGYGYTYVQCPTIGLGTDELRSRQNYTLPISDTMIDRSVWLSSLRYKFIKSISNDVKKSIIEEMDKTPTRVNKREREVTYPLKY